MTIQLGGNIELVGFKELDKGSMVILKKMVGSYARKMSDFSQNFEKLTVHMKSVHEKEKSEKFQLQGKLVDNGKVMNSEITDRNLFFATDKILNNLVSEQQKQK